MPRLDSDTLIQTGPGDDCPPEPPEDYEDDADDDGCCQLCGIEIKPGERHRCPQEDDR